MNISEDYLGKSNNAFDPRCCYSIKILESMDEEERFKTIALTLSPGMVDQLKKSVAKEKATIVSLTIQKVESSYEDKFGVSFSHPKYRNCTAWVVRLIYKGRTYYHADYSLDGIEEGDLANMYRWQDSTWWSGMPSCDQELLKCIGQSIDCYERDGLFTISYN